jgi:hypothetical protein
VSPSKDEIINVSQIAKKSPDQIEKMFGKPSFLDNVNPSGAPCPSVKKTGNFTPVGINVFKKIINPLDWQMIQWK